MEKHKQFLLSNVQFGNFYGTSKSDIIEAEASSQAYFVLDFRIADQAQLASLSHRKVLVFVETESQLDHQITLAGRQARRAEILAEYRTHFSPEQIKIYQQQGFNLVINNFGQLERAVCEVVDLSRTAI